MLMSTERHHEGRFIDIDVLSMHLQKAFVVICPTKIFRNNSACQRGFQ